MFFSPFCIQRFFFFFCYTPSFTYRYLIIINLHMFYVNCFCLSGFADIPSGPSCPYIVRRGLLGTTVVPVSQKEKEDEETD